MRKETSNQFTEGLVSDLNPINTPNTVLTDALNATIITYDGNEHSLQNDRGNYPLENCRLKPNYIPVGIKEYGDILYIVSYNPLNEHVEIGTYPSPLNVESSKDNDTDLELESVIGNIDRSKKYSELVEDCKLHIWTSDNEEDSKLYPGDNYKIEEQNISPYKYEALEYFIIDENRQKYNINDLIKKDGEWHPIAWQVPGWLAAQYRIGTFDDFIMSVKSVEAPTLGDNKPFDCNIDLNFQFRISDYLFLPQIISDQLTNEEEIKSDLGIKLAFSDKASTKEISLKEGSFLDWYSDSKILWLNTSSEDKIILKNVEFGDTVTITATPFVRITVDGTTKEIIYDSFEEKHSIYFNSIGSYSDFTIGDEIWKFYIDEDDDSNLYIEYNVSGPNVTNKAVQLYYRVLDLDGETIIKSWSEVSNYTGITSQGVGILDFKGSFEKEAVYVLEFAFYEPGKDLNEVSNLETIKKLVIASKIFSDFVGEYSNFNDIDFDTWISKYKNSVTSDNWQTNIIDLTKGEEYQNYNWDENGDLSINGKAVFDNNTFLNKLWKNKIVSDKGWDLNNEFEKIKSKFVEFVTGIKRRGQIQVLHKTKALEGKLWDGIPKIEMVYNSFFGASYSKAFSRQDLNANTEEISEPIDILYGSKKVYDYVKDSERMRFISGIRQIQEIPLMWLNLYGYPNGSNQKIEAKLYSNGLIRYDKNGVKIEMEDNLDNFDVEEELTLSETDFYLGNDLCKKILALLGTNDFGIIGVHIDNNYDVYKIRLRYGSTDKEIINHGQSRLATFLVFKERETLSSNAVFIPIQSVNNLWTCNDWYSNKNFTSWMQFDKYVSLLYTGSLDDLKSFTEDLIDQLYICDLNNAFQEGYLIRINIDNSTEKLDLCNVDFVIPSVYEWNYKTGSGLKNILDKNVRISIFEKLGSEKVCGKLLSGRTEELNKIILYSNVLKNTLDTNYLFGNIDNSIININNSITTSSQSSSLIDVIEQMGVNTKGVYMLDDGSEKYNSFTTLLNDVYSSSSSKSLVAYSSNNKELNVYLKNDKNVLVLGKVNSKVTV